MASYGLPGAYISDIDLSLQPKLDTTNAVGSHSHFFQPPSTPSAASSLYRSASIDSSIISTRKRARQDYASDEFATPIPTNIGGWHTNSIQSPESIARSAGAMSPPPFVNTKYRLAGGLDTPTAAVAAAQEAREDGSHYSDVEYRRAWKGAGEKRDISGEENYFPQALANGHQRYPPAGHKEGQNGWSNAVLNVVGGVVGKVWEFAKTSAFRGFYAGGGTGYEMRTDTNQNRLRRTISDDSVWQDVDTNPSTTSFSTISNPFSSGNDPYNRESTPIPGQFPEEGFIPDYISQCSQDTTPPRPSKKVLRDKGGGELKMSWVMVPPPPTSTTTSSTSTRARNIASTTPSRTNPTRRGTAANANTATGSGAKRKVIHPRSSLPATTVSLTSRSPAHKTTASFARAGSPLRSAATSTSAAAAASYASPRSRSPSIAPSTPKTPIQTEVERLAAKKRREEREADRSIKRFNDRLKAMIREGRQALGTKWDIEDDVDGEDMEL